MRIKDAFVGTFENFWDFCQGFVIAIVWLLPVIIIMGIATPIVIVLCRRADVKRKAKFEAAKKAREEAAQHNKQ
jgi:cytochrome c-type biogenesis protein CcmH/NrfF